VAEATDTAVSPDADGLVGGLTLWASDTLPTTKHMFADGSAVSRTLYSLLFSRYGTTHGAGDGSTTFNLPNLTDRVPRGGDGGATTSATGTTGGTSTATMPAHSHTITPNPHSHTIPEGTNANVAGSNIYNLSTVNLTGHSTDPTSLTVSTEGGTGDNWPPHVYLRWIIKVL
jgi:microcystin-dependent protein